METRIVKNICVFHRMLKFNG